MCKTGLWIYLHFSIFFLIPAWFFCVTDTVLWTYQGLKDSQLGSRVSDQETCIPSATGNVMDLVKEGQETSLRSGINFQPQSDFINNQMPVPCRPAGSREVQTLHYLFQLQGTTGGWCNHVSLAVDHIASIASHYRCNIVQELWIWSQLPSKSSCWALHEWGRQPLVNFQIILVVC